MSTAARKARKRAGDPVTIDIRPTARQIHAGAVTIFVHTATAPVYMRHGTTVEPRDPRADMVPPMTIADLPLGRAASGLVTLVCQSDAIVSVCRP